MQRAVFPIGNMPYLRVRGLSTRCLAVAVAVSATVLMPAMGQAAEKGPVKVNARYSIAFLGVNIGDFGFQSDVGAKTYELNSDSRVKLLFGAFKWDSQSRTKGTVSRTPMPDTFDFNYRIKKKQKRSAMRFEGGNAVKLVNSPPANYSGDEVPVKPQHLKGVIDPMTAIMRMTLADDGDACRQSADIFDGRRRIRLTLSPKGRRSIKERSRSGQPGYGYVCRIKFTPVAGHKKDNATSYIARNNDMEIVLRPVPSVGILVPYQILIPTSFGTVSIAARSIDIVDGRNQRIAMQF